MEPISATAVIGTAAVMGAETLGIIGTAAEVVGTAAAVTEVVGGTAAVGGSVASVIAADAVGGAALGAATVAGGEAVVGTGVAAGVGAAATTGLVAGLTAGETAAGGAAGAAAAGAGFEGIFTAAAGEVVKDAVIPTIATSGPGLSTVGVVGAEVAQGTSWVAKAGSLVTKVGTGAKTIAATVGTVSAGTAATVTAAPYVYGVGDVGYRVMTGEGVDEAVVNTAGDIAKLGAKAAGWGLEQFLKDIDPSILIVVGFGAYYF